MSDIMGKMNQETSFEESPKKKSLTGQDLNEEMDLEALIKRLASAAMAIQDLEHDVESPWSMALDITSVPSRKFEKLKIFSCIVVWLSSECLGLASMFSTSPNHPTPQRQNPWFVNH
jgi:hypothetical protein